MKLVLPLKLRRCLWTPSLGAIVALVAIVSLPVPGQASPKYWLVRIKDNGTIFGVPSGSYTRGPQLNDKLEVVMPAYQTVPRAGVWSNGALQRPSLPAGLDDLIPFDINNSTDICGYTYYGFHKHGFFSDLTATVELPVFDSTHYLSNNLLLCMNGEAHGINDAGAISGWLGRKLDNQNKFETRPVIWRGRAGLPEVQGVLSGYPLDSVDYDRPVYINASGQIAGTAVLKTNAQSGVHRAYFGNLGYLVELPQFPGGKYSFAHDISDAGHVVGFGYDSVASGQHIHAFLYHGGSTIDIHGTTYGATFKSVAWGVNASGHAVGAFQSATGANINALYYDGDSTYRLGSLIVNPPGSAGGPPFQNFLVATDINNGGAIVGLYTWNNFDYPCLLWPYFDGVVVNSTGDSPDFDPNDGRCWTGGYNVLGQEECTMRAAIQHTNLTASKDTIRFNIPVGGIPSITINTPLPIVSQPVAINASTQPGAGRIRLNGVGLSAPGISISAGNSEVRGLTINGFDGPGISLTGGDANRIIQNVIGPDTAGAPGLGNYSGIEIENSSNNIIGDADPALGNTIAYNKFPGIRVNSGTGNLFRQNVIYSNGTLGIDLYPTGVDLNDSLDSDAGANGHVNYPYIDSVVHKLGQTRFYGHLMAEPNTGYVIEFFANDSCDPSGYGEGQHSLWTEQVTTNGAGVATYETFLTAVHDTAQFWTATATDFNNNTSEFSRCWPYKMLEIRDGNDQRVSRKEFVLSYVILTKPNFLELTKDTVMTDDSGRVDITELLRKQELQYGDEIRVARVLQHYGNSPSFAVRVDNARFSPSTFMMVFDTLTSAPNQVIRLGHTEIGFNLRVLVEWDADPAYLSKVQTAVREMATYLYDVFDGQIRFDTVSIYDYQHPYRLQQHLADIFILADNYHAPEDEVIGLPRRWAGSRLESVDMSLTESPLAVDNPWHYRAMAQHVALNRLGLYRELLPPDRDGTCGNRTDWFGLMSYPYHLPAREANSEMSWSRNYVDPDCRVTPQFFLHGGSCWEYFENQFEGVYDGVYADIVDPAERLLGNDRFFLGPNDDLSAPDLRVGDKVVFSEPISSRLRSDRLLHTTRFATPPHATVLSYEASDVNRDFPIVQGKTNDVGDIILLGVQEGDIWLANGPSLWYNPPTRVGRNASQAVTTPWHYGLGTVTGSNTDTLHGVIRPVYGDHRLTTVPLLSAASAEFSFKYDNAFQSNPVAVLSDLSGRHDSSGMVDGASEYKSQFSLDSLSSGLIRVSAIDDSSAAFSFDLQYAYIDSLSGQSRLDLSLVGNCWFELHDSGRSALATYTEYPATRAGLHSLSIAVSGSVALSIYPDGALSAGDMITVMYEPRLLPPDTGAYSSESTIRLYRWDPSIAQWHFLGGDVDTVRNRVRSAIQFPGLYAAFTTSAPLAVEDEIEGSLPVSFVLHQSYPNPFNPTATISFSLPSATDYKLTIYNVTGQTVREFAGHAAAGTVSLTWDASGVASGVYLYRLQAGEFTDMKKMLLLK